MAIGDLATATSDGTGTSLTYAHSVAGTTDLAIWVCVDDYRNSPLSDPSGITYAGAALTKLSNFLAGGGNDNAASLWRRIAPSTGSNNVVVTHAQSHDITAMSLSYSGVDQTTPNDTVQALDSTATDPSHSVTSETGDMVVSFVFGWGTAADGWQATAPMTERLENSNTSGVNSMAVGDAPGASPSVTIAWGTTTNPSDPHGLMSFNVNAAGAAAATKAKPPFTRRWRIWNRSSG